MTPELKTACEVVFQEHKLSDQPIKWTKHSFRGQISIGLSELAKETLVKKNIIFWPNKSKKIITLLNPEVAAATSFEEAENLIKYKSQDLVVTKPADYPTYIAHQVFDIDIPQPDHSDQQLPIAGESPSQAAELQWYMKPLFRYVVWPVCAAAAGALITFLIVFAQTQLFLH